MQRSNMYMLYVVKNDDRDGFSLATVDLSGDHRGVQLYFVSQDVQHPTTPDTPWHRQSYQ